MDIVKIRENFPILNMHVPNKPLVYLDNSASSQMPLPVIERINHYQTHEHSNVHRNAHYLGDVATREFEKVRSLVKDFIQASHVEEIIFTGGTTDALNLVAQSYGRKNLQALDEVILSTLEHHSNIVPWQMLRDELGIVIKVIPIDSNGELLLDEYEKLFTPRTKIVGITHASNALGTINPVKEMIKIAHNNGAIVVVDGAQAVPHMPVNVVDLDCDFYAFSSHKMFGPTGVGVLYGKKDLLEKMPPYKGGGEMILSVSFDKTIYNVLPHKFEAGTPPIMPVIGLGAAIEYINTLGINNIETYCQELLTFATTAISQIDGVRLIGRAANKVPVLSFVINGVHPHDVGTILNDAGIAIRTGHHCAEPVMRFLGIPGTARASFSVYNTHDEITQLINALSDVIAIFK